MDTTVAISVQGQQAEQHCNFFSGKLEATFRFHIPTDSQFEIYMTKLHVRSLRPCSTGPFGKLSQLPCSTVRCNNTEVRQPLHLMSHCMFLPDLALYDMSPSAPKDRRRLRTESCPGVDYDSSRSSVVLLTHYQFAHVHNAILVSSVDTCSLFCIHGNTSCTNMDCISNMSRMFPSCAHPRNAQLAKVGFLELRKQAMQKY